MASHRPFARLPHSSQFHVMMQSFFFLLLLLGYGLKGLTVRVDRYVVYGGGVFLRVHVE